jgi:hypothetical protein
MPALRGELPGAQGAFHAESASLDAACFGEVHGRLRGFLPAIPQRHGEGQRGPIHRKNVGVLPLDTDLGGGVQHGREAAVGCARRR